MNLICSIIEQVWMKTRSIKRFATIAKKPKASQRELADSLGFSLGKFNYCLQSLKQKGMVKLIILRKIQKK